jgi:hypothetical protein
MRVHPSITSPLFAAALALAALSGCASAPVATTEQAANADVRAFATFAFFEPLAFEREGYGTLAGERARAVLRREMESRGYRLDPENPALRINLIAGAAEQPRNAPQVSLGLGLGFGGGNSGGGIGIGLPIGGGKRDASRMPAGIAVDLVDERARRVVWTGSVDLERAGRDGQGTALETALLRVMAGLPPRDAGAR